CDERLLDGGWFYPGPVCRVLGDGRFVRAVEHLHLFGAQVQFDGGLVIRVARTQSADRTLITRRGRRHGSQWVHPGPLWPDPDSAFVCATRQMRHTTPQSRAPDTLSNCFATKWRTRKKVRAQGTCPIGANADCP